MSDLKECTFTVENSQQSQRVTEDRDRTGLRAVALGDAPSMFTWVLGTGVPGEILVPRVSAGPRRRPAAPPTGPDPVRRASWPLGGWGGGSAFLQLALPPPNPCPGLLPRPLQDWPRGAAVSRRGRGTEGIQGPLRRDVGSAQKCLEWLAN